MNTDLSTELRELPPDVKVTETRIEAPSGMPRTEELAALCRWAEPFGFNPEVHPTNRPIVRDLANRRILYAVVDMERRGREIAQDDLVTDRFVQLEAEPPPWPPEVRRHIT